MANREPEIDSLKSIKRISGYLFNSTTVTIAISIILLAALKWAIPQFIPYAEHGFLVGAICVGMFTGAMLLAIHVADRWYDCVGGDK